MTRSDGPPVDYLRECSNTSLRYFELSKLEHVANLRRELAVLLDEMMEESALALFARWMLERRAIPAHTSGNGSSARGAEARKASSLLADFIKGAGLLEAFPAGHAARARNLGKGTPHSFPDGSLPKRSPELAVREHTAPHRGEARSQRRPERRGSRPLRPSARPVPNSQ
ncbi:MAG TPA: hypothetical protein VEG63_09185 [Candidatus Acidoferrales bacterium]|nr:hypothetical protein [Candidatus Acidoferrales bacterium]